MCSLGKVELNPAVLDLGQISTSRGYVLFEVLENILPDLVRRARKLFVHLLSQSRHHCFLHRNVVQDNMLLLANEEELRGERPQLRPSQVVAGFYHFID